MNPQKNDKCLAKSDSEPKRKQCKKNVSDEGGEDRRGPQMRGGKIIWGTTPN